MLSFTTPKEATPVQREPLFALDGVTYTIPTRFTPSEMLMYAHATRHYGPDQAVSWALEIALGADGYTTLMNVPPGTIPDEDFGKIIGVVTQRMVGLEAQVPGPKENLTATAPEAASWDSLEPPDSEVWPEDDAKHAAG